MRVSRTDLDAGASGKLTDVRRVDGRELAGASCTCYRNRTGDGKADECVCLAVIDTAHGPRWRASGTVDTIDESPIEKSQREMQERNGTAQPHADEGEDMVERARRECHSRNENAWRKR